MQAFSAYSGGSLNSDYGAQCRIYVTLSNAPSPNICLKLTESTGSYCETTIMNYIVLSLKNHDWISKSCGTDNFDKV